MSLDGIAMAIYERKGQHVVSSTTLSSTNERQIFIERSVTTNIDPSGKETNARAALMTVLDEICSRRAQIANIGQGRDMLVPLPIVHGVAEIHDEAAYTRMICAAFPEYFSGPRAPKIAQRVNNLLAHLFREHHRDHAPKATGDEPPSQIALHPHQLFLPDDPKYAHGFHVSAENERLGTMIKRLLALAKTGDASARAGLVQIAKLDAENYARDMAKRGILDLTRFVQFGIHSDEFKSSPRYTYLEWAHLKDVFIKTLIAFLPEQHNVCLKTPNDQPSPAFADITATFLADVWRLINYHRTGKLAEFKNVHAQRH